MESTISSIGLNDYEEGLVQGHLKVLNTKTHRTWHYQGANMDADLIITKHPITVTSNTCVAILSGDVFKKIDDRCYHLGESLRIFSFLELLQDIEDNTESVFKDDENMQAISAAEQLSFYCHALSDSQTPFQIVINEKIFCQGYSDQNEWHLMTRLPKEELIHQLATQTIDLRKGQLVHIPDTQHEGIHHFSVRAIVWELSIAYPSRKPFKDQLFKISTWPLLGTWHTEPYMPRLSALYGRQFASIAEGARFTNSSETQVHAFLTACQLCQLGIKKQPLPLNQATHTEETTSSSDNHETAGLLKGLRRKLGLAFGYE